MANGIAHAKTATIAATVITVGSVALAVVYGPDAFACAAGAWAAIIVEPDLDSHIVTTSERTIMRFNRVLGFLWICYWYPYQRMFRHRSFWSHMPGVSTAIRLLYVGWLPMLLFPHPAWVWVWLGMTLNDMVHATLDGWRFYR